MPLAVCVRFKDSTQNILQGDEINKDDATNLRGILAVEPVTRLWKHKIKDGRNVTAVQRTQIPSLPQKHCCLHGVQRKTADPCCIAHLSWPRTFSEDQI